MVGEAVAHYRITAKLGEGGMGEVYRAHDPRLGRDVGQLSPDSHWMAYTSDESGQREVYAQLFPAGGRRVKVSITGGEQPRWRGDGKELFFVGADGRIMAVTVKAAPGDTPVFEALSPQPLFEANLAQSAQDSLFENDVTADGKRFLLDIADSGSVPITVVQNWDAGLKK